MPEVTRLLEALAIDEKVTAFDLVPVIYAQLRQLAARKFSHECPGQTLQPTALVHEAWLRLVKDEIRDWKNLRHLLAAAATAMRRILIENARSKQRLKRGGGWTRIDFNECVSGGAVKDEMLLALDGALENFAQVSPEAVRLVELRFFAGFSHREAAEMMGLSRRSADGLWAYARAWLLEELLRE